MAAAAAEDAAAAAAVAAERAKADRAVAVPVRSFRSAYMRDLVGAHAAELEELRVGEGVDSRRVGVLMGALEAGVDVFASLPV